MFKQMIIKMYEKNLQKRFKIKSGAGCSLLTRQFLKDYKVKAIKNPFKIHSIHKKGFSVSSWLFFKLDKNNYKEYLTDAQYYGMHPLNGEFSKWIDDKLTLKYILTGTELNDVMPKYYFQIDKKGNILPLMDYRQKESFCGVGSVVDFLEKTGELAIKQVAGSIGRGFYKAEYKEGRFYLNGDAFDRQALCEKLSSLRNYLIIDYLHPIQEMAEFCPNTVNTVRYLIGRIDGKMQMIGAYVRIGTKKSRFVENYNAGGVLCCVDEQGYFSEGNIVDDATSTNIKITHHPDSNKLLKGRIPLWDEIVVIGEKLDVLFPQMCYLGIDFVLTSNNQVKILEINSLTSFDGIQLDESILNTKNGVFFKERLK